MKPISFRPSTELRNRLFEHSHNVGITLSGLIDYILCDFFSKLDEPPEKVATEELQIAANIGYSLKSSLSTMNSLANQIKAVRKNKIEWPSQADDLLALIDEKYKSIRSYRSQ